MTGKCQQRILILSEGAEQEGMVQKGMVQEGMVIEVGTMMEEKYDGRGHMKRGPHHHREGDISAEVGITTCFEDEAVEVGLWRSLELELEFPGVGGQSVGSGEGDIGDLDRLDDHFVQLGVD